MYKSGEISSNFFKGILFLVMLIFIATLFFDVYLVALNQKLNERGQLLIKKLNVARIFLDYGNGQKRAFEGEVTAGGLTLFETLNLVAEAGNFEVKFKETQGRVVVESIDNYPNNSEHYWEINFPNLDWKKRLDEFDSRQIIFTAGMVANLIYR